MKMPLGHKIEGLIWKIFECCTDLLFKTTYPPFKNSFFWKNPEESDFELVD
jgi:hypothetical protein